MLRRTLRFSTINKQVDDILAKGPLSSLRPQLFRTERGSSTQAHNAFVLLLENKKEQQLNTLGREKGELLAPVMFVNSINEHMIHCDSHQTFEAEVYLDIKTMRKLNVKLTYLGATSYNSGFIKIEPGCCVVTIIGHTNGKTPVSNDIKCNRLLEMAIKKSFNLNASVISEGEQRLIKVNNQHGMPQVVGFASYELDSVSGNFLYSACISVNNNHEAILGYVSSPSTFATYFNDKEGFFQSRYFKSLDDFTTLPYGEAAVSKLQDCIEEQFKLLNWQQGVIPETRLCSVDTLESNMKVIKERIQRRVELDRLFNTPKP